MKEHAYLRWMAKYTDTQWCNDSAIIEEIETALKCGAIGCTSNPPLTYEVLTSTPDIFRSEINKIDKDIAGNERVVELIGIVIRRISKMLYQIYEKTNGQFGYIRAQVQPDLSEDDYAMFKMGSKFASWSKNIKVKIPATEAGMRVLEELAALGIPTNPTICVTVSQIIAAAEANERGIKRAIKNGIKPAASTSAIVMGRLQDYLAVLNKNRGTGLSTYDLECASLAVAKRCYQIFIECGYKQVLMPAAFRCARHVTQMIGSKVIMTIHPKIQDMIIKAEAEGTIKREDAIDNPVDPNAVERVRKALPEFEAAYEPGALKDVEFSDFGGTKMTLKSFDINGWQKLLTI